ncbi:MAG: hypothetical protein ACR2JS_03680 [Candidatus Nanopelagicales bacterium]
MKQHHSELGKGVLFQNDKKAPGSSQPDYKGVITLDRDVKAGEQVKIAAWKKATRVGELISLAQDNFVPDPNWRANNPPVEPSLKKPREHNPFADDEVPF